MSVWDRARMLPTTIERPASPARTTDKTWASDPYATWKTLPIAASPTALEPAAKKPATGGRRGRSNSLCQPAGIAAIGEPFRPALWLVAWKGHSGERPSEYFVALKPKASKAGANKSEVVN